MTKLIMMRGLPASGKSTRAKEIIKKDGNFIRINRDLLRTMLHFDKWSPFKEKMTIETEKELASYYLNNGKNVIIDDTNLGQSHENIWRNIAISKDSKFEIIDCNERATIDMCINRDNNREKYVGEHVIVSMSLQYGLYPKPEKTFVVSDLDGTIADCSHRKHFVADEKNKDWDGFFSMMAFDVPRKDIINKLKEYSIKGHDIVFVTARPEKYREITKEWIERNVGITPVVMIMRKDGDHRPDTEVKEQMYKKYFKDKYPIECVFDDRPCVIEMWRKNGLNVIDVGDGIDF